jgi:hypothetical protein
VSAVEQVINRPVEETRLLRWTFVNGKMVEQLWHTTAMNRDDENLQREDQRSDSRDRDNNEIEIELVIA